jgi:hypothetical protein
VSGIGGFRRASRFGADKILAILFRANFPDVTKDLCKVLLGLETTGHGLRLILAHREHEHSFSTLRPLAQNTLMRGLAR